MVTGKIYSIISKNLRRLRQQGGFTQEKLAEISGVGAKFISEIERGKKKPSLETIYRLVGALRISWDEFLSGEVLLPNPPDNYISNYLSRRLQKLSLEKQKKLTKLLENILDLISPVSQKKNKKRKKNYRRRKEAWLTD